MLNARMSCASTILTLFLSMGCLAAQTSALTDVGDRQLENVQIDTQGISSFFSDLSLTYDIPIGLEIALNDSELSRYHIDFKKGTVTELMTQFIAQHNQYSWKIEDGVVNVFPRDGYRDTVSNDVLATKIKSFSVKEKTSCWNFVEALVSRPETKAILEENGTIYRGRSPSGFYIPHLGRHFTLHVADLTLRSILNKAISKSSTAKFWVITRNPDKTLFINLSARHEDSLLRKAKRPLPETFGDEWPR